LRKQARAFPAFVLVLAFGLLIAGCGGSDSNTSASEKASAAAGTEGSAAQGNAPGSEAPTISKAEFVKRASAICAETKANLTKELTPELEGSRGASSKGKEAISTTIQHNLAARLDSIRALGVPSEGEATVDEILSLMAEQLEESAKLEPLKFSESKGAKLQADEPEKEYGLTACALSWL
jgi:hypothetical protein